MSTQLKPQERSFDLRLRCCEVVFEEVLRNAVSDWMLFDVQKLNSSLVTIVLTGSFAEC